MFSQLPNLEYIKYIEPHLSTKIVEFLLRQAPNDELKKLYKNLLIATNDFEKIKSENLLEQKEIDELKSKNEKEIKDLEEKLKAFLSLSENCEKQNTHDLTFFSLGKKIIEETSPIDILKYSAKLFDYKNYDKALSILTSFSIFHENSPKIKSKVIYALYLLYSIRIFTEKPTEKIVEDFNNILLGLEKFNNILDEKFKKSEFDSMEKVQIDFKEILLYRGYLVHWALFTIKYNSSLFLDTLFESKCFSIIENSFPYLYKYLIVLSIINKSRKFVLKLQDSLLKKKNYLINNKDCFIELLENIFIQFNSQDAIKSLEQCKAMMKNDYFLNEFIEQFDKKVKEFVLENYLLLNESILIDEIKVFYGGKDTETKNNIMELIQYYYPNSTIKDENNKITYSVPDDEMNNYYKIKTQELYSLTENMVEYFKQNK